VLLSVTVPCQAVPAQTLIMVLEALGVVITAMEPMHLQHLMVLAEAVVGETHHPPTMPQATLGMEATLEHVEYTLLGQ